MNKNKELIAQFKAELQQISKKLDKTASEITQAEYSTNKSNKGPTEAQIRLRGGFNNIKELLFGKIQDKDAFYGTKLLKRHKDAVTKEYATKSYLFEELESRLVEELHKLKVKYHKPLKVNKKKTKMSRTIVAVLSDAHYGKTVELEEVVTNKYDWEVAARRTAFFLKQVAEYKLEHRADTNLALVLGGDLFEGLLHNVEDIDNLTYQFLGTYEILAQGISYLASKFSSIDIYFTPGNHGRNVARHKERATASKYDSFENMLAGVLKRHLHALYKNIKFNIAKSPYIDFKIQGHRFFVTHGDNVIKSPNVGSSINIKNISNDINKLNASLKDSEEYKVVIVGHLHTAFSLLLDNGSHLIMNGSIIGGDPFAVSLGIFDTTAAQILFETTPQHPVGDLRIVKLNEADNDKSLETIITPYNYGL